MLLLSLIGLVLLHVLFLVSYIRRGPNVVFLVAAAFIVVAPLSAATLLPQVETLKYLRVYLSCLIAALGFIFLFRNHERLGTVTWLLLAFGSFYIMASIWSDHRTYALMHKGLFGLVVVGGMLMAYASQSIEWLKLGIRTLSIGGAVFAGILIVNWLQNPDALSQFGRLASFGMNPNRIGQTVAPLLILAVFCAFYDTARSKLFAYMLIPALVILLLGTGSRSSVGMAILGCFVLALPVVRNPGVLTLGTIVIAGAIWAFFRLIQATGAERLAEADFTNRYAVWADGLELFFEQPVIGHGWISTVGAVTAESTRNLHNAYIQILAETGATGLILFLIAGAFLVLRPARLVLQAPRESPTKPLATLATALAVAILAHMFVESGNLAGTTLNALLLGMTAGLADRIYAWERAAQGALVYRPPQPPLAAASVST